MAAGFAEVPSRPTPISITISLGCRSTHSAAGKIWKGFRRRATGPKNLGPYNQTTSRPFALASTRRLAAPLQEPHILPRVACGKKKTRKTRKAATSASLAGTSVVGTVLSGWAMTRRSGMELSLALHTEGIHHSGDGAGMNALPRRQVVGGPVWACHDVRRVDCRNRTSGNGI